MPNLNLVLKSNEALLLKRELDIRVIELRNELVHTDNHDYRASLKRDLIALEDLARRIDAMIEAPLSLAI